MAVYKPGQRAIAATKPSQSRIRSTALPRGELFCSAVDGVPALSVTCGDSSPKGRALGKTKSFFSSPEPPPLGEVDLRSKDGEGEDAALNHAADGLH